MAERPGAFEGDRIAELWSDERCDWHLAHEYGYYGNPSTWRVDLEWTQEWNNPHQADWATFVWAFYGDTSHEAMAGAVKWLEELLPWKRCDACGGEGDHHQEACADCGGSGLAEPQHSGASEGGDRG